MGKRLKIKMLRTCVFLSTLLFALGLCAAEITYINKSSTKYGIDYIKIVGKIERGDYEKLVNLIKEIGLIPAPLAIKSPGGDVMEAKKIGRLARRALLTITVDEECSSSCFLILAGGVTRLSAEPIGLHRPIYGKSYFSGLSYDEAQNQYKELNSKVRGYLIEMDVPLDVVDKMMSTPNENVFMWDGWTASMTRLGHDAPGYHEWISAKCGALSKEEENDSLLLGYANILLQRDAKVLSENDKYIIKQAQAIPKGYSEYLKKTSSKIAECKISSESIERQKVYNALN